MPMLEDIVSFSMLRLPRGICLRGVGQSLKGRFYLCQGLCCSSSSQTILVHWLHSAAISLRCWHVSTLFRLSIRHRLDCAEAHLPRMWIWDGLLKPHCRCQVEKAELCNELAQWPFAKDGYTYWNRVEPGTSPSESSSMPTISCWRHLIVNRVFPERRASAAHERRYIFPSCSSSVKDLRHICPGSG